jgi:hypothetical protein
VIRRLLLQSYGRYRRCYEAGLARDPALSGSVTTRFVIQKDGSISSQADAGSDLPDEAVVRCIVNVPVGVMPRSEDVVTVIYTLALYPR